MATIDGDDRRAVLDRWRETVDWFAGRETTVDADEGERNRKTVMKVMLGFKNRKTVFGVRRLLKGRAGNLRPVTTNAGQEYEALAGDDGVGAILHGKAPKFRNSTQISPSTSSSPISGTSPLRPTPSIPPQPSPVSMPLIPSQPSPMSMPSIPPQPSPPSTPSRTSTRLVPFVGENVTGAREGERGAAVTPVRRGKQLIEAAVRTGSYDAAMRLVEENDPVWYIVGRKSLSNYFESKFENVDHLYADRSAYGRESFVREFVTDFRTVRVLVGRTGLGKTEYALAHFRQPLHVRDNEDWRRLSRSTDGIVLDAVDFREWSPANYRKLLDISRPVTQNINYGCVRIPARIPRFIIVNHMDLLWPARMHPAIKMACERRMTVEQLDDPLFDVSATGNDGGSSAREERTVSELSPSTGGRRRRADRSPSPRRRDDATSKSKRRPLRAESPVAGPSRLTDDASERRRDEDDSVIEHENELI
ncbi:hypothetical protein Trydic_g2742 [Trypoxylus dichotomus]